MTNEEIRYWIERDPPSFPEITEEVREAVKRESHLYRDLRLATGLFYTDEEFDAYREEVLSSPLP